MCNRGSWRSFSTTHVQGHLCVAQQCTDCGSHRLKVLDENTPVTGLPGQHPEEKQSATEPDEESGGEEFNPFGSDDEGW